MIQNQKNIKESIAVLELKAIYQAKKSNDVAVVARNFGKGIPDIRDWMNNEEEITAMITSVYGLRQPTNNNKGRRIEKPGVDLYVLETVLRNEIQVERREDLIHIPQSVDADFYDGNGRRLRTVA